MPPIEPFCAACKEVIDGGAKAAVQQADRLKSVAEKLIAVKEMTSEEANAIMLPVARAEVALIRAVRAAKKALKPRIKAPAEWRSLLDEV